MGITRKPPGLAAQVYPGVGPVGPRRLRASAEPPRWGWALAACTPDQGVAVQMNLLWLN